MLLAGRKAAHNLKVRTRILSAAAKLFRGRGYAGSSVDALMQASGLTRGAFYAHFRSKDALFAAVLESQHPLLSRLEALPTATPCALIDLFRAYLKPDHLTEISQGCTFVSLSGEVAKLADPQRLALAGARCRVLAEMQRVAGPEANEAQLDAGFALATGALQAAAVEPDERRRAKILAAAINGFETLLPIG